MNGAPAQGAAVPNEHAIVRYCAPSTLANGVPEAGSFARKRAHNYLSVNDADLAAGATLRDRMANSKILMEPWLEMKPSGVLAAVPVQAIVTIETALPLRVTHEPVPATNSKAANPFHCGIHGVPTEDDMRQGQTSVLIALAAAAVATAQFWLVRDL